jgi:hypothetical protein
MFRQAARPVLSCRQAQADERRVHSSQRKHDIRDKEIDMLASDDRERLRAIAGDEQIEAVG